MEILKSLFRSIVRLVAINIALILFFASAPLLYVTVPFWVILTHESIADMATIYMLTSPFACGFWMTVICHWHTVRKAQREGRLANWRDTEGGMFCTVGKSIGFMVMGWFGSALAEVAFCGAAGNLLHSTTGRLEFFAMAPFAVFAPIWLVLLCRWMRSRKREDFISGAKGDRELREKLHAISLQAKSMRSQNAH
ncbi:MAG: hypothetical protein ABR881_27940 [Candidatus Sulfotelmatobacter sp.]